MMHLLIFGALVLGSSAETNCSDYNWRHILYVIWLLGEFYDAVAYHTGLFVQGTTMIVSFSDDSRDESDTDTNDFDSPYYHVLPCYGIPRG